MDAAPKVIASLARGAPEGAPIEPLALALLALFERDGLLLQLGAHERSVAHHLAVHLEKHFPELNVDCEYNRLGPLPKRIHAFDGARRRARRVFPDIVVHRRGGNSDNRLIIEMKLTTSSGDDVYDLVKLDAYRAELGYHYAVFLKLLAGSTELGLEQVVWLK